MNMLNERLTRVSLSAIVIVLLVFSSVTAALAWTDFTQSKTNVFKGLVDKASVVLNKYDKTTNVPIRDAHFELYMLFSDGSPDRKIGGTYATNSSGKITIPGLSTGNYKFVEIDPSYGYEYDKDEQGNDITEYHFSISEEDTLEAEFAEVNAYNVKKTGSFEIIKRVIPRDGSQGAGNGEDSSGENGGDSDDDLVIGDEIEFPDDSEADSEEEGDDGVEENDEEDDSDSSGEQENDSSDEEEPAEETPEVDDNQSFEFTVTFSDDNQYKYKLIPDGGSTLHELTEDNKLLLKDGQRAIFQDVPIGITYSVVEKHYPQYHTTSENSHGVIKSNEVVLVTFTNGPPAPPPPNKVTELIVKKLVEGEVPESEEDREFWFTYIKNDEEPFRFPLKAGEEKIFVLQETDTYSITEDNYFQFGYMLKTVVNGSGTASTALIEAVFTNEYFGTEWVTINGEKTWVLDGASASVIPASIVVNLLDDDEQIVETKIITPNQDGEWTYSFLAKKYSDTGLEIDYKVSEVVPPGFEVLYIGPNIVNTYTDKKEISVLKLWEDDNSPIRPREVKVQLYKDNVAEGGKIILNSDNDWRYTWRNLPASSTYTVKEEAEDIPEGYVAEVSGNETNGFIVKNYKVDDNEELILTGGKSWIHKNNPKENWPEKVTIIVKKDGEKVASAIITEKEHWTYQFRLPKYENGNLIEYTIDEEDVESYSKSINDLNITNTYVENPDITVTIAGKKTWKHNNNPAASHPTSIRVLILKGDEVVAEKEVSETDDWQYSFKLPRYEEDGKTVIRYKLAEANVKGYKGQIDGHNIINTFESEDYPGDDPNGNLVKTGDDANPFLWIAMMIVGLVVLGTITWFYIRPLSINSRYMPKH